VFVEKLGDWGRDMALYVGRMHGGQTLAELAEHAGTTLDAVSKAVARMRRRMRQDRALTSRYRDVQQALGL
jgi:DNA-directed RNA polymerase specialized sigma24 family protein